MVLIFISVSRCGYIDLDKKENSAKILGGVVREKMLL